MVVDAGGDDEVQFPVTVQAGEDKTGDDAAGGRGDDRRRPETANAVAEKHLDRSVAVGDDVGRAVPIQVAHSQRGRIRARR